MQVKERPQYFRVQFLLTTWKRSFMQPDPIAQKQMAVSMPHTQWHRLLLRANNHPNFGRLTPGIRSSQPFTWRCASSGTEARASNQPQDRFTFEDGVIMRRVPLQVAS